MQKWANPSQPAQDKTAICIQHTLGRAGLNEKRKQPSAGCYTCPLEETIAGQRVLPVTGQAPSGEPHFSHCDVSCSLRYMPASISRESVNGGGGGVGHRYGYNPPPKQP